MRSIAPIFSVVLRNPIFEKVAIFDNPLKLSYTKEVNGIGSFSFSISLLDSRTAIFYVDSIVEIQRSIPGMGVTRYTDFVGLCRGFKSEVSSDGSQIFTVSGLGLNDLLARTIINYSAATIKSYKLAPSETVMKEYVDENCGPLATLFWERKTNGVLPNFSVEASTGAGIEWEGDRAFENLLDVLISVAKFSSIDLAVNWSVTGGFVFQTFLNQLGADRSTVGMDRTTGKNGAGNVPVIFSLENGTMSDISLNYDRSGECNSVSVLGEGDGATRLIQVRTKPTIADSPYNRREVARPLSGFENEMQVYGDEVLEEAAAVEIITITPISQPSLLYGVHYFLGDRVSIFFQGVHRHRRISSISVSAESMESIKISFF
jgi:hypothetical protein